MSHRYVCIHGHFYQPPRENPFTGKVQDQPSAHPFPNWNARIEAESYGPNLRAPILDSDGGVRQVVNNFAWISYDAGPTLLSWLEEHSPDTYQGIVDADRQSALNLGGRGSAMAQSYNHTILPLSPETEKRTQVKWGIADFAHRYGRPPEGMWLPEAAVDNATLEVLIDEGIAFTVLAPSQAAQVESISGEWTDVSDGSIDPRSSYYAEPAPGKRIAVFFYDGPLSQGIAFNGLLEDGTVLARTLLGSMGPDSGSAVLVNVATDGETFGHHHSFGEMALAAAIETISAESEVELTNYATFLSLHPPQRLVQISDGSSWSCAHGVERWRSDCGCSTGGDPGWNQEWRGPLRGALDYLSEAVAADFESARGNYLLDPWRARDSYIEVILGRAPGDFLTDHVVEGLGAVEREHALTLLRIQHHAMLMYTSCGWFFNDISGLESVFVLRQAGRVIELTRDLSGQDLEPGFLGRLDEAKSNRAGLTGRDIYLAEVSPFMGQTTSRAG